MGKLRVTAASRSERLELTIADDGGNAVRDGTSGSRLGLRNVAERLRVHYGAEASFKSRALPAGGFVNRLSLPLECGT